MSKQLHKTLSLFLTLALVTSVVAAAVPAALGREEAASVTEPVREANTIPAPAAGGPRPTITANPNSGYAGEEIVLSGQGVAGYPGVRLAWVLEDTTRTLDVVTIDDNGEYSATVLVPVEAETGTNQICAAVTGTEQAEFACIDFTVETPPPVTVNGQLPLPEGATSRKMQQGTTINAYDAMGNVVASTETDSEGGFTFSDLAPGRTRIGVEGDTPVLVEPYEDLFEAAEVLDVILNGADCSDATITVLSASPVAAPADGSADWGTYIALGSGGDAVNVTFEAAVQHTIAIDHVEFEIVDANGSTINIGSDSVAPYEASYNVSLLPTGISALRATPVIAGGTAPQPCQTGTKSIKVVANPLQSSFIIGNQISWNASQEQYTFDGQIPDLGGTLPLVWPDPPPTLPAPLNNKLRNELNAGLLFEADVDLSGRVTFRMLAAELYGEVFNQTVFDQGFGLKSVGVNAVQVDPHNVRQLAVDYGPHKVKEYHKQKTIFAGVLFTAGFVDVRVTVKLGIDGALYLEGTFQPLLPAFESTLTANANPQLIGTIAVSARAARIEGRLIPNILLSVPLLVRTTTQPYVTPQTPCLIFALDVNARVKIRNPAPWTPPWSTIFDKTKNVYDKHLPSGCSAPGRVPLATVAAPPARLLPSPDIAAGPLGQILTAYVTDATPDQEEATSVIAVRFRDSSTSPLGTEILLTSGDGSRNVVNVADPAVAFVGDTGAALAVWTETAITPIEAEQMTGAPEEIMAHQEIAYAYYDGSSWSTPQRLTDDLVPDGMADIDGDLSGATLAWVHDTGGVSANQASILMRQWDLSTADWSAPLGFNAYPDSAGSTNHQVTVDRQDYPGGESYMALAWTADEDGDLSTLDDRYLALATKRQPDPDPWFTQVLTEATGLSAGFDSPSIALIDPQNNGFERIDLAFLNRNGITLEGQTVNLGTFSNQAQVWQASKFPVEGWRVGPLLDEQGVPAIGEAPQLRLTNAATEETLLAFRRFGDADGIGLTGQMAVSKDGLPPLPYTTDLNQHWLPAFAVDFTTGDALLVNVSQSFNLSSAQRARLEHQLTANSTQAQPAAETSAFAAVANGAVETIRVEPEADPALDANLALSQQHANAGASVEVTATVRNLGVGETGNLTLELYDGTPMTGTLLFTDTLATLASNDSVPVSASVTASGGSQRLTAELAVDSGDDLSPANNRANANLGALPAPTTLDVQPSSQFDDALMLSWVAPPVPGVAGYRILRATSSGGPYQLIGETINPFFTDRELSRGTYYYVVQAYDATGTRSPFSVEAMETFSPEFDLFVPLIQQNAS